MKYAIVENGGKQYKAVEGGTIEVDRLPLEEGTSIKLDHILLLADGDDITVGTPIIQGNPIWVKVLEHFKGEKVTIFNYSPKKRIRVKIGHRQNYTRLLVEQIGGTALVRKEPVEKIVKTETSLVQDQPKEEEKIEAKSAAAKKVEPAAKTAPKKSSSKAASAARARTSSARPKAEAKKAVKPAADKKTKKPAAKKVIKPAADKNAKKPAAKKSESE
jgi:large subunit ribosomal protein L21